MAKKSKKRQLEGDSNDSEKVNAKSHVNNDGPNKKKIKITSDKSEKKDDSNITKQNDLNKKEVPKNKKLQNVSNKPNDASSISAAIGEKLKKKMKKKVKKQDNSSKVTPSDSINKESEKSRRQELFAKKRAEHKEKKKLLGSRKGLTAAVENLSLTEMKKKIAEIESRETISKTARRKLRILKIKVQVQESGGDKKDETSEKISKADEKDKVHNKTDVNTANSKVEGKKSIDKKKKKDKFASKDLEKNLFIEDRVGNAVADNSVNKKNKKENESNFNKSTKNVKQLKKNTSGISKVRNNDEDEDIDDSKVRNSEEDEDIDEDNDIDSEEDEDEDIDESENESNEENKNLGGIINKSESAESDEDGNDSETKNVQEDEEGNQFDAKKKNAQDKANKKSNKVKPNEMVPKKNQRYVLFVGNIAYDSTTVDLKKHFLTKVEKVKDVRIPLNPGTNKPRGFAYVEVENSEDYEKALSLHNTFVNGRQLNVEYTASGSKKGNRKPEVIHKNKKLHALRKEGKLAGSKKFSNKRSFRRNFKNNPKKEFGKKK